MNSEELEQSLRTEFENYLKDVVAELRQSVSDFQEKINADFEKHKEQLELTLGELNESIGKDKELEVSFTETVAEHLKLARDEGASITAAAFAEAEKMDEAEGQDFSDLRDAIGEISGKDSQSEILKTLVNHAAAFTPRGAFFIVKNEHLVGWRVFGREDHDDPKVVREVFFPVATNTALSEAVESLSTVSESANDSEDDVMYRNKLGFVSPDQMYAIPLIARGRGVAVLYADSGTSGEPVNLAALEALMRVAGLTVEVLAATPQVSRQKDEADYSSGTDAETHVDEPDVDEVEVEAEAVVAEDSFVDESDEEPYSREYPGDDAVDDTESTDSDSYDFQPISAPADEFEPIESEFEASETAFDQEVTETADVDDYGQDATPEDATYEAPVAFQESTWDESESIPSPDFEATFDSGATATEFDSAAESETPAAFEAFDPGINEPYVEPVSEAADDSFEFDSGSEPAVAEDELTDAYGFDDEMEATSEEFSFDEREESTYQFESEENDDVDEAPVNEAVEVEAEAPHVETVPPVRSRFADRNLDLPIEVSEDERRLHNDARRFARLLVSEIKLYNEQKVKEGRESSDLYERLREAIDRSREMYDKRVQPPVAAKFDYFNYELVNTLAEGDEVKLGSSYPGAAV